MITSNTSVENQQKHVKVTVELANIWLESNGTLRSVKGKIIIDLRWFNISPFWKNGFLGSRYRSCYIDDLTWLGKFLALELQVSTVVIHKKTKLDMI